MSSTSAISVGCIATTVEPPVGNWGTVTPARSVQPHMDDIEREALLAAGLNPDDPAVLTAITLCGGTLACWGTLVDGLRRRNPDCNW